MAKPIHTSLGKWIDEIGVAKLASILDLEISTVYKWRDGSQIPKALHMRAVVRLSKGAITYESMIEPWARANPSPMDVASL